MSMLCVYFMKHHYSILIPRVFHGYKRDSSKSLKQVVTALLLNAQQQVWESQVLKDDYYKRISRVTAVVARLRILTSQSP